MTRSRLNTTLNYAYALLILVLAVSLATKLADQIPGVAGTRLERIAAEIYDYLKDMALVLVTVVAAYLANVFQKRSKFIQGLEEEWRGIVRTKSALYAFCEKTYPTADDYLAAYCRISETLDNMRIVYRNLGETDELIGLYPYAPLHDMRRALQTLDPRKTPTIPPEQRRLARDAILQSFSALRENFLEELDLEKPAHSLLISGGRRLKRSGATASAKAEQERQALRRDKLPSTRPDVDTYLHDLYAREQVSDAFARDASPAPAPSGVRS